MSLQLTKVFGVVLAVLALIGFTRDGHWLGLMNVDAVMDMLRVVLAAAGLYIGFVSRSFGQARSYLTTVGVLFIAMAVLGLVSPTLFGLLPAGLTGFDIVFHLAAGALAAWAGAQQSSHTLAHR